ncbi:hypothetical protein ABZ725_18265 [Streptomyces sp. NPDC006872]|uniref:hypothetical protein n=1 Tax=Streptomyces sp. NPDC006872 TaxID=3155720 RepID=UPI0033EDC451
MAIDLKQTAIDPDIAVLEGGGDPADTRADAEWAYDFEPDVSRPLDLSPLNRTIVPS